MRLIAYEVKGGPEPVRLVTDLAECRQDRPRRPRVYDRVVKVKASKYAAKRAHHRQRTRDIEKDLCLVATEFT